MSEETNEKAQEEPYEGSKLQLTRQRDLFKRAAENLQSQVQELYNDQEHINDLNREIETLKAERDELKRENDRLRKDYWDKPV